MAHPVVAITDALSAIAAELELAERQRSPVEPITARFPGFTVADAYRVQSAVMGQRLSAGAKLVGHKVGLTNQAMQKQLGVDEPDFGRLLDDMELSDGGEASLASLIAPRIEPEICFVLGRSLVGPGVTVADVLAATEAVAPALEIIDSRIADWRINLPDTIADNASSARVVVGPRRSIAGLDLAEMTGSLLRDGEVAGAGTGAAVLGHPASAVAWLANTLADFGESLAAGEFVIPGALCASVPLASGKVFVAGLEGLGEVSIRVVP